MIQIKVLNEKEIEEFNHQFNTDYKIIHIKQFRNNYSVIADCDIKFKMCKEEVAKYLK